MAPVSLHSNKLTMANAQQLVKSMNTREVFFDRSREYHYYCAPMSALDTITILPQVVEPRRLVNQGISLTGEIDQALCDRLAGAVIKVNHPILADLDFDVSVQNRKTVKLKASTQVTVACQRCLEPLDLQLAIDTELGIVWSEEEEKLLPKALDAWLVADETADIAALIEDELLLALPFVNYHSKDECSVITGYVTEEPVKLTNSESSEVVNPFSILAQYKSGVPKK